MGLLTVLKTIGKDLSDVEVWVKDGIAIAGPIISTLDPPLGPIIAAVEKILNVLPSSAVTASSVQTLVTSMATAQGSMCSCSPCSCCPGATAANSPVPIPAPIQAWLGS